MQFRFCAEHATANAITFTVRGAASSCDAGRLSDYETRGTHFALTAALQCFFNRMLAQSHCNYSARFHVSRGGTEYRKWEGNVDRRRREDRGAEGTDWGEGPWPWFNPHPTPHIGPHQDCSLGLERGVFWTSRYRLGLGIIRLIYIALQTSNLTKKSLLSTEIFRPPISISV